MEKPILDTIREFINQLEHIERHKTGSGLELSLAVKLPGRYDIEGPPTIKLEASFYDGAHHQTCKAASLDSLMGEVKHRLGFEDREAVRLQALSESFKALPAPRTFDDNDMFVEQPKRFGEV